VKLFRVVTERDGAKTKEPGTSTEIVREEFRFAAESIEVVWKAIDWIRHDPERSLIAIVEDAPMVTVLQQVEV
jgi:hypothetical protein